MRLMSEMTMVLVSLYLTRRFYPTPYPWARIMEYVGVALLIFLGAEWVGAQCETQPLVRYGLNTALFAGYLAYLVRRDKIDLKGMVQAVLKRK